MSGIPGDPPAPRRPRPADPDEPSTFRPNPDRPRKPKAGGGGAAPAPINPGRGPNWYERLLFGRVGSGQLSAFCRQFAAYLHAGVDISRSLTNLRAQFSGTALGPVIGRLLDGVKRGDAFSEAVAREPEAFDALFVGMMKVAEARGGIPETLKSLGRHYEKRQSLIRQARSAMIYPVVVLFVASGVIAMLTIWLLPMFAELLKDVAGRGADLPLPSRVLMAFSGFVRSSGWLVIPVVMIGTPVGLIQAYRTAAGKRVLDRVLLRIPVFGPLARKIDTTRFARTLSTLLEAGVDMGSSLQLSSDVMQLDPFRTAVLDARTLVLHGGELSEALGTTRRFGPDVIAVVHSGEETGKLPETLTHLADDYEEQVAYMVRNMGQLLQPLMMVVLGGIVLFIILAVLLPYISLLSNLGKPPG